LFEAATAIDRHKIYVAYKLYLIIEYLSEPDVCLFVSSQISYGVPMRINFLGTAKTRYNVVMEADAETERIITLFSTVSVILDNLTTALNDVEFGRRTVKAAKS